ncbi:MAG TPA: hypothetical protein PKC65_00780 [Pyrinomonadaceae bacterium]|jgi:hypothetical protein|nr:hypothetical protein [Pyrinomonadaceae bacterium]
MFDRYKDDGGRGLSEFTDESQSHRSYLWAIGIGLFINSLSWAVAFFTPTAVAEWVGLVMDISTNAKAFLFAFPFMSTFVAVYALTRLPRYKNPTAAIGDSDVFANYRDTERSSYIYKRVLFSFAVAGVNTILLLVMTDFGK